MFWLHFSGLLNFCLEYVRSHYTSFPFSWFWNSVIIINVPLAPGTKEVASVGMVACLANSSCFPCYYTRLWETTIQALVSTHLPYVHHLDWQPLLCCSMDDHYHWWVSFIMVLWIVLMLILVKVTQSRNFTIKVE